jgi:hypothetical protein
MLDRKEFREWCRKEETRNLVRIVLLAQAHAEDVRARVDEYVRPIFDNFNFQYAGETAERFKKVGPIPWKPHDKDDLFMIIGVDPRLKGGSEDHEYGEYWVALHQAHRAHGYRHVRMGQCPALIAENLLCQAQGVLIDAAEPIIGITRSQIAGNDKWDKYLNLLIGAVLAEQRRWFDQQCTPQAIQAFVERRDV